jgi:membrane-associated protease RseP (regulator of RpoE activity)
MSVQAPAAGQPLDGQVENTVVAPPLGETERSSIAADDLESIRSIFGIDSFFATETIPYGEGAIFKGNLRTEAATALSQLTDRLRAAVGDRFRVYLVQDRDDKPAAVVLPTRIVERPSPPAANALAAGLGVASLLTTLELGANLNGFSLMVAPTRWVEALPIVSGIFGVLVLHEFGHRWMADRYDVRLSWPFVVPTLGLGTLGSLTRIESPLPSRKALFDIAIAGPAVSGVLSFAILIAGFALSGQTSDIFIPSLIFQNSILVGTLAKLMLGAQLPAEVVGIHPLVAVGWLGLVITALSLLPAGQLDGGRIVQAVYGRKVAGRATVVTLIVLAVSALGNIIALYWALLIFTVVREPERPPLNEIDETDGQRDALALLALFLMAMTLLPIAPALAGRLGIGL